MKTKHKVIMAAVILVAGVICGILLSFRFAGPVNRFVSDRQLARAQKFMDQMDYEQAVIAFQAAIQIEPKKTDAYLGLANAYQELGKPETAVKVLATGYEATQDREVAGEMRDMVQSLYDSYMEDGDYEKAGKILELFYETTGDRDAKKQLDELKEQEQLDQQSRQFLDRIYQACQAGNTDYVVNIMNTAEYQTFLETMQDKTCYPSSEGKSVAVFKNKALYYGDLKSGRREGSGLWIKTDSESTNIYEGPWMNDMPEGSGKVIFTKYSPGGGVVYTATTQGIFSRGKENGSMTLVHVQNNQTNTFTYMAADGKAQPMNGVRQNRNYDQYVVAVSREHSENEFVTTESEEYGVYGFIANPGGGIPIA